MPRPSYLALALHVPMAAVLLAAGLLAAVSMGARAAQVDADALARPHQDKAALRLIVQPPAGTDSDEMVIATLGEGGPSMELRDDGQGVDKVEGDGTWVGVLEGPPPTGEVLFTLTSADGQLLWSDVIPVDARLSEPWVALIFTETRVVVDLGGGSAAGPDAGGPPGAGPPGAGPPSAGPQGDKGPPGGMSGPGPGQNKPSGAWMWPLLAGILGMITGWFLRGRRRLRLPPQVAPEPAPTRPDALGTLSRDRLEQPITDRARRGLVLVVPRPDRRESWSRLALGLPVVRWLDIDRPTSRQVRRARRAMASIGPTTLVIDGLDALEPPDDDEAPDAVLQELIEDGDGEILLVVDADQSGEGAPSA